MLKTAVSEPKGLARAAEDQAADRQFAVEVSARHALIEAQNNHAANIKLQRLGRKEPIVADLLEEHAALRATVENLRAAHAALETKHLEHVTAATEIVTENATLKQRLEVAAADLARIAENCEALARDRTKLGQDLEAARGEAGKARAELARMKDKKP